MDREVVTDGYPFRYYRWSDGRFGFREPNYRAVKLYLIEKYGVCFFCGKSVKDYPHEDGVRKKPDQATIDHLVPHPHNKAPVGREKHQSVEKVLACLQCNHSRNVATQRAHNRLLAENAK